MEIDVARFAEAKEKAHAIYTAEREIWCPYFQTKVVLNSDGFHHLQFSARREREKQEQLFKLRLLPLALQIIRKSGTIQEYRKLLSPIGKASNGAIPMKEVEYWGLVGILGEKRIKVRAVLRRVGSGNVTFWSVMPYSKIRGGVQKMYADGLEDD